MGFFDGIENASATKSGNYLREGKYWLQIVALKMHQKDDGTQLFISELRVVRVLDDENGKGHKVGEDVAYVIKRTGNKNYLPNSKALFAAALAMKEEDISGDICNKCLSEEQPLSGVVIEFVARRQEKKTKPGEFFTKVVPMRRLDLEELTSAGVAA